MSEIWELEQEEDKHSANVRETISRLSERVRELEAQLDKLHGHKFSERDFTGLTSRAETAEARLSQAERLLRELEWVPDSDGPHSQYCPSCGGILKRHEVYCRLAAFLHPEKEKKE